MPHTYWDTEHHARIVGQDGILRAGCQPALAGLFTSDSGGLPARPTVLAVCPAGTGPTRRDRIAGFSAGIERGEFKLPLFGFDELPGDWELDGVGVVRLEAGQHLGHFIGDKDSVIGMTPEHEKGLAIGQEPEFGAFLDQLRDWLGLRERGGNGSGEDHSVPPGRFRTCDNLVDECDDEGHRAGAWDLDRHGFQGPSRSSRY
jgi:hypothetical protein